MADKVVCPSLKAFKSSTDRCGAILWIGAALLAAWIVGLGRMGYRVFYRDV